MTGIFRILPGAAGSTFFGRQPVARRGYASLITSRFPQAEAYFRSVDRLGECLRSPSDDSIRAKDDGLIPMRFAISAWVSPAFVLAVNSASNAANSSSSKRLVGFFQLRISGEQPRCFLPGVLHGFIFLFIHA
jgi:hypothetical protein